MRIYSFDAAVLWGNLVCIIQSMITERFESINKDHLKPIL